MEAIDDPVERDAFFKTMVAKFYENGKAINIASVLEIDQVIDPIETRHWIMSGLRSAPKPPHRAGRKRPCVDAW
jgi:acetyl-CoA carboxylase carboxyltransferase component